MNNHNILTKTNIKVSRPVSICFTFLMYHVAGLSQLISVIHNPFILNVIPSSKLNIVDILEALEKYKCQIVVGLPKILNNLINHPNRKAYDLSNLFFASSGGQTVSSDLIIKLKRELNIKIFSSGYSSTEVLSPVIKIFFLDYFNPNLYQYCVGKQSAFTETKIVDPITKAIQPHNVEGELYFRGHFMTIGYWKDEEKTREVIDENGWYVKILFSKPLYKIIEFLLQVHFFVFCVL